MKTNSITYFNTTLYFFLLQYLTLSFFGPIPIYIFFYVLQCQNLFVYLKTGVFRQAVKITLRINKLHLFPLIPMIVLYFMLRDDIKLQLKEHSKGVTYECRWYGNVSKSRQYLRKHLDKKHILLIVQRMCIV